ncbi:MAG: hypothetical protein M1836_006492 [Candelina mexicana]|nr:MAG: hypothetical protein M1836_006492 [Candelina mexicana]
MPPTTRCFSNEGALSSEPPLPHLVASLTNMITNCPPGEASAGGGLYAGPLSIAYLLHRLYPLYPDLEIEGQYLGTWCAAYMKQVEGSLRTGEFSEPRPHKCGVISDILVILAFSAASSKDKDLAQQFLAYVEEVIDADAYPEWLYGQAGYLYLLRMVREAFSNDRPMHSRIQSIAEEVIDALVDTPRPWKWHGKAYVGAVHGAIGIITQIVLTSPSRAREVEKDLDHVLDIQTGSGNWPSSLPRGDDRLVQVCHGAPGVVISLLSIRPHFPNLKDRIDDAVQRGREHIWTHGLLTKEPGLCHGISGNALAMGDKAFQHFLTFTTQDVLERGFAARTFQESDDPFSLWSGEAGRAWAWAVADKGLERTLIGYNDI